MPLAAIGPVAGMIGSTVFGYRIPLMGTIRAPIGQALSSMVVTYLLTPGRGLHLGARRRCAGAELPLDQEPAPGTQVRGLQQHGQLGVEDLLAHPGAPLAGHPGAVQIMYLGLPVLMKAPEDRAAAYTILVILAALVLFW
jgi:hypothetical protein